MGETNITAHEPYIQVQEPGYCGQKSKTAIWGPRAVMCFETHSSVLQCIGEPHIPAKEPYK